MTTLEGKRVLVAGDPGPLGHAIAARLMAEGARAAACGGISAAGAISLEGAPSLSDDAETIVAAAVTKLGGLDAIVTAFGAETQLPLRLGDSSPDQWTEVVERSLDATFFLIRAALGPMLATGEGTIVGIAPLDGLEGSERTTLQGAAAAGVAGLIRALTVDYAHLGIRANTVCPANIAGPAWLAFVGGEADPEAARRREQSIIPMGRPGQPRDVAQAVVWLVGDGSPYVAGQQLYVDGGLHAGHVAREQ